MTMQPSAGLGPVKLHPTHSGVGPSLGPGLKELKQAFETLKPRIKCPLLSILLKPSY